MSSNGLRYLRWGGDGEAVQPEKWQGVENCLKCAQNPQRQVHALLGAVELEDSLAEKRHCAAKSDQTWKPTDKFLHTTWFLAMTKKLLPNSETEPKNQNKIYENFDRRNEADFRNLT